MCPCWPNSSLFAMPARPGASCTLSAFGRPGGSDSIYVVLTGGPVEGGSATLTITGREAPLVKQDLPYEFLVYPWPMDQPRTLKVRTQGPGRDSPQTLSLELPGTP